ncbi:hypothetical protein P9112_008730 [Eukaryota sp. TZLM1-RC]
MANNSLNDSFCLPQCVELSSLVVLASQESAKSHHSAIQLMEPLSDFFVVSSVFMASIGLTLLARNCLRSQISCISTSKHAEGPIKLPNKGSVSISLCISGCPFLFSCLHLVHGESPAVLTQRCSSFFNCLSAPSSKSCPLHPGERTVVAAGDLNFRIHGLCRSLANKVISKDEIQVLLENDQLNRIMNNNLLLNCLKGKIFLNFINTFNEAAINFAPTYKYNFLGNEFDTSKKQRCPAFTDRILYKGCNSFIQCQDYGSLHFVNCSDHKPVYAVFEVKLVMGCEVQLPEPKKCCIL